MIHIYKLTCPNGKVYIGQTKQDNLNLRWQCGRGYIKNQPLYEDILEYGWKNFQHEVLEDVETKEEAIQKEREYILSCRSNEPEFGYNKHINQSSQPKLHHYVRCKETGEVFKTMAAAGDKYGRTDSAISYAVIHNTLCADLHWEKVLMTHEEYEEIVKI